MKPDNPCQEEHRVEQSHRRTDGHSQQSRSHLFVVVFEKALGLRRNQLTFCINSGQEHTVPSLSSKQESPVRICSIYSESSTHDCAINNNSTTAPCTTRRRTDGLRSSLFVSL